MPFVTRNGVQLHYRVSGHGPFVAIQHALTSDNRAFEITGLRKRLMDAGLCCVAMDAVGHGKSDPSADAARYALKEQALDLLAVMDDAGAHDFSAYGYSMGGWIVTGAAVAAPARIRKAIVGGWDILEGARHFTALAGDCVARGEEFEDTVRGLFAVRPGSPSVAPRQLAAFVASYQQLFAPLPDLEALKGAGTSWRFICGGDDPYRANVVCAASRLGAPCEIVDGDHLQAFVSPGTDSFVCAQLAAPDLVV